MTRRSRFTPRAIGPAFATAVLLVVGVANATLAQTVLSSIDNTGDGYADTWAIDDNDDGTIDRLLIDAGQDGSAEVTVYTALGGGLGWAAIDASLDGLVDIGMVPVYTNGAITSWTFWADLDQNGRWENAYWDGNGDDYPEWVCVDADGDGSADTWRANVAPAGRSAGDEIARQVGALGAFDILRAGNVPIFGPLVLPMGG